MWIDLGVQTVACASQISTTRDTSRVQLIWVPHATLEFHGEEMTYLFAVLGIHTCFCQRLEYQSARTPAPLFPGFLCPSDRQCSNGTWGLAGTRWGSWGWWLCHLIPPHSSHVDHTLVNTHHTSIIKPQSTELKNYIFSHLKLCFATAIHNIKWPKICVICEI